MVLYRHYLPREDVTFMLDIKGLCCIRNDRVLFSQLTFSVQSGEFIQVEGPNGAGKTSLLRIIAGLAIADQGDILWCGKSIRKSLDEYNQNLLYLGHHVGIKSALSPFENLSFYQKVANQPVEAIWDALANVGLVGFEDVPVARLSAGQQRRVALARLWLSKAPLWILDEPLTAIDKKGVEQLITLFDKHVQEGGMVLLTTHQDMLTAKHQIRKITLSGGEWH